MNTFARLRRMSHGSQFHALGLHATELTNPFLGIDHAWMSGPIFPPHPHAGFSAVSYLFLDSETGINNKDSLGGRHLILPGACTGLLRAAAWCTRRSSPRTARPCTCCRSS